MITKPIIHCSGASVALLLLNGRTPEQVLERQERRQAWRLTLHVRSQEGSGGVQPDVRSNRTRRQRRGASNPWTQLWWKLEVVLRHQMQINNQLQTAPQQQQQRGRGSARHHHGRPDQACDEGTDTAPQRRRHQTHRQASTVQRRRGKVSHVRAPVVRIHERCLAAGKKRDAVGSRQAEEEWTSSST